jgi:hypothetical protein
MVMVGANMPEITFSLTPDASIQGRVTLANGDPAGGIRFWTYQKALFQNHQKWVRTGTALTNSDGVFRLNEVDAPNSFVICSEPVSDHEGEIIHQRVVMGYASVCFPGAAEFSEAQPLRLAVGQWK